MDNHYNKFKNLVKQLTNMRDKCLSNKNISDSSHICAIFCKQHCILATGINHCRGMHDHTIGSIHAEIDSVQNLPQRPKNKKIKNLNMLVIKVSKKTHALSMSKPCIRCIDELLYMPNLYRYKINKIYYSTNIEHIVCKKLTDLIDDEFHVTRHYKDKGFRGKYVEFVPS